MEFGVTVGTWGVGLGRWRCEGGVFVVERIKYVMSVVCSPGNWLNNNRRIHHVCYQASSPSTTRPRTCADE